MSDVVRSVDAYQELVIPVEMTPRQFQLYQTVLARRLEVLNGTGGLLASPRATTNGVIPAANLPTSPAAVSSLQRAAQLRGVYGDLRKVCSHPYLLPELEPEPDVTQQQHPHPDHHQQLKALGAAEALRSNEPGGVVSGKFQVLSRILASLTEEGKTVLLLSHTPKVALA